MITTQQAITFQAEDWFSIEPSDRYNFVGDTQRNPKGYRHAALFIGVGGDINVVSYTGANEVLKNLPNGTFLPLACVRVNTSGTTCQNIIGVVQKSKV